MENQKLQNMVKFSFPRITTFLNNEEVEKKKMNIKFKWENITKTQFNKNHKAFAVRTGKISGITVFDFDDRETYNNLVKQHPELKECYTVSTNKGCHIYFNYNSSIE